MSASFWNFLDRISPAGRQLLAAPSSLLFIASRAFATQHHASSMPSPDTAPAGPPQQARPFTLSLGAKPPPKASVPAKRPRAAFADDDSDNEDARGPQAVSGIGEDGLAVSANGGATKKQKKEPMVIPVQRDADWRLRTQGKGRGRNLLPDEEQARRQAETRGDARGQNVRKGAEDADLGVAEEDAQYGLLVKQRTENGQDGEPMEVAQDVAAQDAAPPKPKTEDEEAYDRLVNGQKRRSNLVIGDADQDANETVGFISRRHDEGNFRSDVAARPEASTVADYEAVPIEDFGAALLRGMGWTEGGGVGRSRTKAVQPKTLERRANLLGIGAKHTPEGLEELGAWGKGAQKGPKTRESYNPVVMRNTKTGETMTEEEKAERDKMRVQEERERKEKKSRDAEGDGDRQRKERKERHRDRREEDDDHRRRERRDRDRDRYRDSNRDENRSRYDNRRRSRSREDKKGHRTRSTERKRYDGDERQGDTHRSRGDRDNREKEGYKHRSRREHDGDYDRRKNHRNDYDDDTRSRRR